MPFAHAAFYVALNHVMNACVIFIKMRERHPMLIGRGDGKANEEMKPQSCELNRL